MDIKNYCFKGKEEFSLKDYDTKDTAEFSSKKETIELLAANQARMAQLQDRLYAEN